MRKSFPMQLWRAGHGRPTELHIGRMTWDRGVVGDGVGYSSKLSVKLQWVPQDLWIGAFWKTRPGDFTLWVCLLPCLPVRIHLVRSFGGRFP